MELSDPQTPSGSALWPVKQNRLANTTKEKSNKWKIVQLRLRARRLGRYDSRLPRRAGNIQSLNTLILTPLNKSANLYIALSA